MDERRGRAAAARIAIVAAAIATAVGPSAHAAPAQNSVPAPTVSATELRVGTELTIVGTGCADAESGAPGELIAVLQRPGDPPGSGIPLTSGTAAADGRFELSVTIGQPLPNGALHVAVGCFESEPPTTDNIIAIYPLVDVTAQSPPITGLEVDAASLALDDPCADFPASAGMSVLTTLIGPGGQSLLLDAVAAVDGRITQALPDDLGAGRWTVIAECYGPRQALPRVILAGSFVRELVDPAPSVPSGSPVAGPAVPVSGDASYTG